MPTPTFPPLVAKYALPVEPICVVDAYVAERTPNAFVPLHVLLSAKSVDDAAVIVCVPPAVNAVPFRVRRVPVKRLVPIEVVATTVPDPFVERSAFVSPAKES